MNDVPLTLCITAHHGRYLTECLISVAAQTVDNFNVVLCLDSTGDRAAVSGLADSLLPFIRARRVSVIQIAGGTAGVVRNAAFASATTQWVTYLDGDDIIAPNALETIISFSESHEADLMSSGIFRICSDGTRTDTVSSLTYRPPLWIYQVDPRTLGHWVYFNQLFAIRRELWQEYRFVESPTNWEDIDFVLHQLLAGRFIKVPYPLYGYRAVSGSFSTRDYVTGDICSQRYASGYYAELFARRYTPALASNFALDVLDN